MSAHHIAERASSVGGCPSAALHHAEVLEGEPVACHIVQVEVQLELTVSLHGALHIEVVVVHLGARFGHLALSVIFVVGGLVAIGTEVEGGVVG